MLLNLLQFARFFVSIKLFEQIANKKAIQIRARKKFVNVLKRSFRAAILINRARPPYPHRAV